MTDKDALLRRALVVLRAYAREHPRYQNLLFGEASPTQDPNGVHALIPCITAALEDDGWMPIETAPKDGIFLVYDGGAIRTMWRQAGEWQHLAYAAIVGEFGDNIVGKDAERLTGGRKLKVCDCIDEPTHWQLLPPLPKGEKL